jgi:predicted AlkP superfamily phosphohydrolase/phosphomutase
LYRQPLFENLPDLKLGLTDIYCEVDRQIGGLVENVGPDTAVFVFSLHGMRPTHGVPTFLQPLLCERGYAKMASWATKSWTERAIAVMATVKRHTPSAIKKMYYRTMPPTTTMRLARPTMLAGFDWKETRVFPLPADQHGWVHVNLKGREGKGIVDPQEYEGLCQELEQMLRALKASDGRPIVHKVFRTAQNVDQAMAQTLPDLVVHWEDAAFSTPLKIQDTNFESEPTGKKFTGRHALDGFCIVKGASQFSEQTTLRATELHQLITDELFRQKPGAKSKGANV